MKLIHYSDNPLTRVRSIVQVMQYKPRGLWFSVGDGDDGWRAWCEGEGWGLDRLAHATEIVLTRSARILRLSSVEKIDEFSAEYSDRSKFCVDWTTVAGKYQGIIIAPYCWQRRLTDHTFWYYGWDCASGCVWDADAVGKLRSLGKPAIPPDILMAG